MSWIWWAIATFGIGGVLLGGAIFLCGFPAIIGSRIGRLALGVVAVIIIFYGVHLRGKREGRKAEREKLKRITAKEVDHAEAEAKRIDGLSDDDVDRELRKRWSNK